MQVPTRTGDRDIEEAALLGQRIRALRMTDGHETLFDPGQMHDGPLESFGGVERGQFDRIAVGIGLVGSGRAGEPRDEPGR